MINKNFTQIKTLILEGISLINRGEFFKAHETLEIAWHLEKNPIRRLYQGLIQFSVACYHAQRKNWVGARRVLARANDNLTPFARVDSLFDVPDLLQQIAAMDENIRRTMVSTVTDSEILVSPRVKLSGCNGTSINPG